MATETLKPKIAVIGGCIVDLVSYVPRFPKPGETLIGQKFHQDFGGKGANQCVMVAKLEEPVAMIAKVGNDSFGDGFIKHFKSLSINDDHVTVESSTHTSTGNIVVTPEGENSIVNVFGAIDHLSTDDAIRAAQDLFHSCELLICTYECPRTTLLEIMKVARASGVKTLVNAAPCGEEPFEELYPHIDIICVNEIEAEFVCGKKVSNLAEAEIAIKALFAKGKFEAVILTLGANGALVMSSSHLVHVPAPNVKAIDTTGAGDSFMGSLGYFLVKFKHLSLEEITKRACEIASISVLGEGTQKSFPKKSQIPDHIFQ